MRFSPSVFALLLLAFSLASCGGQGESELFQSELFVPPPVVETAVPPVTPLSTRRAASAPTASPTLTLSPPSPSPAAATPTLPSTVAVSLPTPTPPCDPGLRYLGDLSLPDGSVVAPGQVIDKRWQVENSGSCNWEASYRLVQIGGPNLGAPQETALYPARSGSQAVIRLRFSAPVELGYYRSAWQAHTPAGLPFGDPVYIEFNVEPPV